MSEKSLQSELDDAMRTLDLATNQKTDQGFAGLTAFGSALGIALGLGLMLTFPPVGLLIVALYVIRTAQYLRSAFTSPAQMQDAITKICAIGPRITGEEHLSMSDNDRFNLHLLLREADSTLAKSLFRLMAVCGDTNSLSLADHVANGLEKYVVSQQDEQVRLTAAWCSSIIRQRFHLSQTSGVLLRSSSSRNGMELTRPARAPIGLLARPVYSEDESADP